jgi:WD40 repeat protein
MGNIFINIKADQTMKNYRHLHFIFFIPLWVLLLSLSACTTNTDRNPNIHKDFLANFIKDSENSDGSFESSVRSLAYSEEGKYLLVGHESGSIDIWDTTQGHAKHTIQAHNYRDRVNSLTFTVDGKSFFSNSESEGVTQLWDVKTGKLLHSIPDTRGPVGITPNKNIYIIANTSELSFFDYSQMALLPEKYEVSGVITSLATDIRSGQIAIGTASGSIEIWKFSKDGTKLYFRKVSTTKPYSGSNWIVGLQFSPDGKSLYSVARFGFLDIWTAHALEKKQTISLPLKQIYKTAFYRDKDLLAVTGTTDDRGVGAGFVSLISPSTDIVKIYRVNTNSAVVEFISSLNLLIASQHKSTKIYDLSLEK